MANTNTVINQATASAATKAAKALSVNAAATAKQKRVGTANATPALGVQQQTVAISQTPARQIMNQLNILQTDADKNMAAVLKVRKGKEALVARIYAEYFAAQQLDELQALVEEIDKALKEKKIAFRINSRVSTKFVRYVFANYGEDDLSDKEAFKYGRGIDVGFSKRIDPEQFASFVVDNGGYSNIKEQIDTTETPGTPAGSTKGASMLESLSNRKTAHELEVDDWADENENYRVYIAVRNDDNLALLKAVNLSQDGIEKLMLQVEREQKEKDKPNADEKKEADDAYRRRLEAKIANCETDLGNKRCDLDAAIANRSPTRIFELRTDVRCLEADVKAAKAEMKKFKDEKAAN